MHSKMLMKIHEQTKYISKCVQWNDVKSKNGTIITSASKRVFTSFASFWSNGFNVKSSRLHSKQRFCLSLLVCCFSSPFDIFAICYSLTNEFHSLNRHLLLLLSGTIGTEAINSTRTEFQNHHKHKMIINWRNYLFFLVLVLVPNTGNPLQRAISLSFLFFVVATVKYFSVFFFDQFLFIIIFFFVSIY